MLDRTLSLPADALARVLRRENLGEPHIVVAPEARWHPREVERAADEATMASLARGGWVDRRGRLDADLVATLRLVCTPLVEFYGWIADGERTLAVLVAASGRDSVVAIHADDSVLLRQGQPDRLPEQLVAHLPDIPPGRGTPVTVVPDDLQPSRSVSVRAQPAELRQALALATLPTTGGGQLYAAVRDATGRRHASEPLRYADTVRGRWVNTTGPDGRIVIAPVSRAALAVRLGDLGDTL